MRVFKKLKKKTSSTIYKLKSSLKRMSKKISFKVVLIVLAIVLLVAAVILADYFSKNSSGSIGKSSNSGTSSNSVSLSGDFKINLPPTIYAVSDREINIYFDNILYSKKENYNIDVVCDIGAHQSDRWTCTPSLTGTYSLVVNIYEENTLVGTASTNIMVQNSSAGEGQTRNLLFIGDNETMSGQYTGELLNIQSNDVLKLKLFGTKGAGENVHEGYDQATVKWFNTNALSPFIYLGGYNFSDYMTNHGYTSMDFVFINLGINDVFEYTSDDLLSAQITSVLAGLDDMISDIHSYNKDIKIGIMVTIPPSLNQDGFGFIYQSGQTGFRYKRNNSIWVSELIAHFKDKETQKVFLVPVNVNLDTENNMQTEDIPANDRTSKLITRQVDGIYPANSGYSQMADEIFYFIKHFET